MPDTIVDIGILAFEINMPNSVTKICDYAFRGCLSLENIKLPNGLNTINSNA